MSTLRTKNEKTLAPPVRPGAPAPILPSQEDIRLRAYQNYCARNGAPGDAIEDWLNAERELRKAVQSAPGCNTGREKVLLAAPGAGDSNDPVC